MQQVVVYIDVLYVVNLIVDYFILLACAKVLHRHEKRLRILLGAAVGAFSSMAIFLPSMNFLLSALLKLAFSVVIVAAAFRFTSAKQLIKLTACFYVISFVFGGIISAVWLFFTPPGLLVRNGVLYYDISPIALILASACCYIAVMLFSRFLHRHIPNEELYRVSVGLMGKNAAMDALLDTGNSLCDAITGLPVMVAEYRSVEKLIPGELRLFFRRGETGDLGSVAGSALRGRVRVVPYRAVGGPEGLLPAFRPDRIAVLGKKTQMEIRDALVAVSPVPLSSDDRYRALLNPHMFKEFTV